MAGVWPLCSTATPVLRSGYGEGKLPDRCHSVCMYRSVRTVMHHACHRDRSRRRCSFSYQGRRLAARVQRHCYQVMQGRHRTSSTGIPLVQSISERLAQPGFLRQSGAFLHQPVMQRYQQRFTAWLPVAQLLGGHVFILLPRTVHRYVSGLPLPSLPERLLLI